MQGRQNEKSSAQYFDPEDENIKREILMMVTQFLDEAGFRSTAQVLSDEAKFISTKDSNKKQELAILKSALQSNDWAQIETLQIDKSQPPRFIYQLYRHHFLDLLVNGDAYAALQFLSSRIRPYKAFEDPPEDFEYLCKLLVNSSSSSQPDALPNLSNSLQNLLLLVDTTLQEVTLPFADQSASIANGRLVHLIQQAVSLQLAKFSRGAVKSIVTDFEPAILPTTTVKALPAEHKGPIKALCAVPETDTLLSGSADGTVIIWDLKRRMKQCILKGHRGRVWSVAAKKPNLAVSGGGDGNVCVWSLQNRTTKYVIEDSKNDVYSVDIDQSGAKLITGGFDRKFSLYDLETGKSIFQKNEHQASITSVQFDPSGNMAITGGKDLSIRIWDLRNALVVRDLSPVLSEVTSVHSDRSFTRILGSTKNSTIRIWDLRMSEAVTLLKGHQNASKHFVRACFGPDDRNVLSGSDDGQVYVWGSTFGAILEKLPAHPKGAYGMIYCPTSKTFASYGEDNVIQLWEPKLN